eukprot:6210331-Prymnesium_polylepis.2
MARRVRIEEWRAACARAAARTVADGERTRRVVDADDVAREGGALFDGRAVVAEHRLRTRGDGIPQPCCYDEFLSAAAKTSSLTLLLRLPSLVLLPRQHPQPCC